VGDYAYCGPTSGTVATVDGNPNNPFAVAPPTAGNQAIPASQAAGVVGAMRNLSMSVTAASATATLTADEIIVETALGGFRYCLPSFSKTINLATTGAGGMDTGVAPVSGYVALYAIYNPTTQTAALLAQNASTLKPNVYGGANMPAGYTASALVSVWPTNASAQLVIGYQLDRTAYTTSVTVLSTSVNQPTLTSLFIAAAVPPNAKTVTGISACNSTVASNGFLNVGASVSGITVQNMNFTIPGGAFGAQTCFNRVPLITPQTIFYQANVTAGTGTYGILINSYDF
jgi:hypothetical protein